MLRDEDRGRKARRQFGHQSAKSIDPAQRGTDHDYASGHWAFSMRVLPIKESSYGEHNRALT
jgi:hypothetical protein